MTRFEDFERTVSRQAASFDSLPPLGLTILALHGEVAELSSILHDAAESAEPGERAMGGLDLDAYLDDEDIVDSMASVGRILRLLAHAATALGFTLGEAAEADTKR